MSDHLPKPHLPASLNFLLTSFHECPLPSGVPAPGLRLRNSDATCKRGISLRMADKKGKGTASLSKESAPVDQKAKEEGAPAAAAAPAADADAEAKAQAEAEVKFCS